MPLDTAIRHFNDNVQRIEAEHGGPPPASEHQATLDWNLNLGLASLGVALRDLYEALREQPSPPDL